MLIVDRVLCDCCGQPMGQLYNQSAPQPDLLLDLSLRPYFAVCPDCEPSEQAADLEQAGE
ncbi:hypothetical protein N5C54_20915 [Pseudomonas chengduensis]|nr:hypothetical protein [Pseudomonas chengduensis]MDH0960245.1 hypothetical protein [Pseudomonas chengduensis]